MDRLELIEFAEDILETHKEILLIDPFFRIKLEITEGDFTSKSIEDSSPMSWIIQLNPEKHKDSFDIQYSILEALLKILFEDLDLAKNPQELDKIKNKVIARLTAAFCEVLSLEDEEDLSDED